MSKHEFISEHDQDAATGAEKRRKTALNNAQAPAADTLEPFKHRPLNLDKTQIRLFRLQPAEPGGNLAGIIAIHNLEHCPKYKAVSYTWGPPYPTREISLEGQSFTIRDNLLQFLDAVRSHTKNWLWIDQVCIDQSAVDERNHQVGLMAKIYAKAFEVLIWLGTEADGSGEAMEAIDSGFHSTRQHESQVQTLFRRRYWDRLWILQEVLMGQNILVLCGNKSFTWGRLEALFIPRGSGGDGLWAYPVRIYNVALSLIEEKASFEGANRRLGYMLEGFAGLQCGDVRDKVYGLLSLVRSSGAIPVDYSKTSADVFFNAIRRIVKDESFMEIESHFDVGRHLRDRMMLVDISDSEIFDFIKELREIRRESILENDGVNQYIEDRDNRDLLLWAAENGDGAVVKLLLEKGADLEAKDDYGRTLLWWAAEYGYEVVVKLLLEKGADLETKDNHDQTPLWWAAQHGHEAVVKLLLKSGADLEAKDKKYGRTPLWRAAEYGREAVVKLLLEKGADLEAQDNDYGQTPLWRAAEYGHEAVVKVLLEKGANLEAKDKKYGRMPLWQAAQNGHEAVVKLLLEKGADLKAKDNYGWTLLCWATQYGHEVLVKLLLENGDDLEAKYNYGQTSLWLAAQHGHGAVVRLLLEKGADLEAKDKKYGRTPLWRAAEYGHEAVVKLLLENGAALEAKDNHCGQTPLWWAIKNGHEPVVKLLLEKGADSEAKDKFGRTLLWWAAQHGHETVVKLLLENGADLEAKDNHSRTPLSWAAEYGHEAVVKLLLEKGADLEAKDNYSQTPLLWATKYGHEAVVKLLLKKGA